MINGEETEQNRRNRKTRKTEKNREKQKNAEAPLQPAAVLLGLAGWLKRKYTGRAGPATRQPDLFVNLRWTILWRMRAL